jgi:hypothetical protein
MRTTVIAFLYCSIFFSCNIIDPAEPEAGFIRLDSATLAADYPTEGSSNSKITDAWVSVDDEYLGTFPVPGTFPLIANGSHKLSIRAGITDNGISATRVAYPHFSTWQQNVVVEKGKTLSFHPEFNYTPNTHFPQIEDFDDGSLSLISSGNSNAVLTVTNSGDTNALENNSGHVVLDNIANVFEVATNDTFFIPVGFSPYIELNYKTQVEFNIGVYIHTDVGVLQTSLLTVRSTDQWKKIYVDMVSLLDLSLLQSATGYKIYIHAEKPSSLTTAEIFLDNLKVVY